MLNLTAVSFLTITDLALAAALEAFSGQSVDPPVSDAHIVPVSFSESCGQRH